MQGYCECETPAVVGDKVKYCGRCGASVLVTDVVDPMAGGQGVSSPPTSSVPKPEDDTE